jgi:hypothetical protein
MILMHDEWAGGEVKETAGNTAQFSILTIGINGPGTEQAATTRHRR